MQKHLFLQVRVLIYLTLVAMVACHSSQSSDAVLHEEIKAVEAAFNNAVRQRGIHQGFLEFAAEDAILIRNAKAVEGRQAIKDRFSQTSDTGAELSWTPRKIEVAGSGDLAYSFGDYIYVTVD
ncbi:MAG: hypothetical protein KDC53_15710, partial [Saprospiraceae bacterium]|nr:hypothetical protein [Saprospiraceae bacterium]